MRHHTMVLPTDIRPMRSLGLLSVAHAINHAQAVVLPLIFLGIIDEFGVSVETIAFLAAIGAFLSGIVQLSYAGLTRVASRRHLLGFGGILFGGGFALQAFASSFVTFAIPNVASRIGGSPQHPVGNGLLAEQFPTDRRGFAISAHIAGGNVGTVVVAVIGVPAHRRGRLARRVDRVRPAGHRRGDRDPALRARGRHRPGGRQGKRDGPGGVRADPARPRPALALPHLGARRRRARPGRRQPLRPDLHDPRPRPRRGHLGADVRRAHRLLGADAARRRLAVRPGRAQAADRRRLSRRRTRVRRLPRGRLVAALAVGRDRADGPLHVLREPAAPGPPRRHRPAVEPRRVVRVLLRDGVRGRVAVDRGLRRGHPGATARRRACRSCSG